MVELLRTMRFLINEAEFDQDLDREMIAERKTLSVIIGRYFSATSMRISRRSGCPRTGLQDRSADKFRMARGPPRNRGCLSRTSTFQEQATRITSTLIFWRCLGRGRW